MRKLIREFWNMPVSVKAFAAVLIVLCICCITALVIFPAAILLISLFI